MNAPVSHLPSGQRPRPTAREAAAELHAAGEALCRAARVIAELGSSKGHPEVPHAAPQQPREEPIERLSGKQLGAIRAASRRAGLSRDRLASLLVELTGKQEPSALSRSDASIVLDKLSTLTGYTR